MIDSGVSVYIFFQCVLRESMSHNLLFICFQLETAVDGLTQTQGQGAEAISEHGQQFLEAVKAVAESSAEERDRLAEELEEVKRVRDQHLKDGMDVLRVSKPEDEPAVSGGNEAMDNREKKS